MFSMGMPQKLANPDCSPGPKYFMHPKITRKGHDGTPAFSIYERRKEPSLAQTPGPGQEKHHSVFLVTTLSDDACLGVADAYCPERADRLNFHSAPACSLSGRHKEISSKQSPSNFWHLLKFKLQMTQSNGTRELLDLFLQVQPHTPCPPYWDPVLLSHLQLLPTPSPAAIKLTVNRTK